MGSIGLSFSDDRADERPRSLTSAVQERLRADILSTRLLPGQKLHIAGLAKQFSVSLAAVREALSRLVADGLVQASDQRGFRVSPVSPADLRDVTQTRIDIEGLARSAAAHVAALMQGYEDQPPAGVTVPAGNFYNRYFPGHTLAMPPPLSDKRVDYTDGSPMTVEQYAKDISAFLMWTAEPHLEARKRLGMQVVIFLIVLSGLLYFTKKKVWANAH